MKLKEFFKTYKEWAEFHNEYVAAEKRRKERYDDYVYDLIQVINNHFDNQPERDLHLLWFRLTDINYGEWIKICENLERFSKLHRIAQHVYGLKKDDFYERKEQAKSVPIVKVFEHLGIKLDRNNKACCPFHNETQPSLKVYPDTNSFFCFGCSAAGDGITLVMKKLDLNFKEALGVLNDI